MNQPCINCGSEEVTTTEGKVETVRGEIYHVQRVCRGCGFSMRMRWGNDSIPDRVGRMGVVPDGVLLVGDEQEIGSTE